MDKQNRAFLLYGSYSKQVKKLDNEEAGALFKYILDYVNEDETKETLSPLADMVFSMIEEHLARDKNRYDEICEKRRLAGLMGGRPRKEKSNAFEEKAKKANGFSEKQTGKAKSQIQDTITSNNIQETIIKDNVGQNPTPPPYKVIIDYLNEQTGQNYRTTTKATQRVINARIAEGFSVEDFKKVIRVKTEQWLRNDKMRSFLRPETLFAASHFESYLNEAKEPAKPKSKYGDVDFAALLKRDEEKLKATQAKTESDDFDYYGFD